VLPDTGTKSAIRTFLDAWPPPQADMSKAKVNKSPRRAVRRRVCGCMANTSLFLLSIKVGTDRSIVRLCPLKHGWRRRMIVKI
jgi:hypothetical protein